MYNEGFQMFYDEESEEEKKCIHVGSVIIGDSITTSVKLTNTGSAATFIFTDDLQAEFSDMQVDEMVKLIIYCNLLFLAAIL